MNDRHTAPQAATDYSDIIDLPHHRSARHPHMTMSERAAQFASFDAVRLNDPPSDHSPAHK